MCSALSRPFLQGELPLRAGTHALLLGVTAEAGLRRVEQRQGPELAAVVEERGSRGLRQLVFPTSARAGEQVELAVPVHEQQEAPSWAVLSPQRLESAGKAVPKVEAERALKPAQPTEAGQELKLQAPNQRPRPKAQGLESPTSS